MFAHALLAIVALSLSNLVSSQSSVSTSYIPLPSLNITWDTIPQNICADKPCGPRGEQLGYNQCNSTTTGPDSLCQTSVVNNLANFCLWAPSGPNTTISDSEAVEVAWCTDPALGARVIDPKCITGAQVLYATGGAYMQIAGFLDQTCFNMPANDEGGELDDWGDDEEGNPMGGLKFSNYFGNNAQTFDTELRNGTAYDLTNEVREIYWFDFIGGDMFCLRVCDPSLPESPLLCNHIYDEIGCYYNAPAAYAQINNTFEVCDTDNVVPIGQYVVDGVTSTWTQGWSGTISVPYTASIPSSSNCYTYSASELWPSAYSYWSSASPSATASGMATGIAASGSRTGSGANVAQTGASSGTIVKTSSLPYMAAGFFITTLLTAAAILV